MWHAQDLRQKEEDRKGKQNRSVFLARRLPEKVSQNEHEVLRKACR